MRYMQLKITAEDRNKISKRTNGDEQFKTGIFGQVELLRRLLELSPKCTKMADVTQLMRINRKLDNIEDDDPPVLELPEDEWNWVKTILDHDKYSTYGPHLMKIFGGLLEVICDAKTEQINAVIKEVV